MKVELDFPGKNKKPDANFPLRVIQIQIPSSFEYTWGFKGNFSFGKKIHNIIIYFEGIILYLYIHRSICGSEMWDLKYFVQLILTSGFPRIEFTGSV